MNLTQQRFYGYQQTPLLWEGEFRGLSQLILEHKDLTINSQIDDSIRLGNYVEQMVFYQLSQEKETEVLERNLQILSNKITLGELDCLMMHNKQAIHLEIAYKFYLYIPELGSSFIEHWIGPNRRDSLVLKLNKLTNKQFSLLYSPACKPLLDSFNLIPNEIIQKTLFKAQLFLPYRSEIKFYHLNKLCVSGFYISTNELNLFADCKFYIPRKLDWLINPHTQVDWMNFQKILNKIHKFHQKKSAPLCWMKHPNGEINKVFVIWW